MLNKDIKQSVKVDKTGSVFVLFNLGMFTELCLVSAALPVFAYHWLPSPFPE